MSKNQTTLKPRTPLSLVRLLNAAIRDHKRFVLTYPTGEGVEALRYISPYEVRQTSTSRVLIGWDHQRDQYRTFKLSDIEAAAVVDAEAYEVSA